MDFLSLPILIFSPLIAIAIILAPFFPKNILKVAKFSKTFMCAHFVYSLLFLIFYNPKSFGLSYEKELTIFNDAWLEPLGISATFGIDGISLLFVVLTSFMTLVALIISKNTIAEKQKLYYSMIFLLLSSILGVFCARDMFLFFLFWELELIPMYFLISQFGSKNAKKSAMKFVLYTFFGSIFILFAMLSLYFCNLDITSELTANIEYLDITNSKYSDWFQALIFACFFIGFAVKIPVIPLHSWLPDAHSDAPTPVSILLASILLKIGVYGLIRFNITIFPNIFKEFAPILAILGAINILYTSCIALKQTDAKRVVAYSSIANMGIVLIGFSAMNYIGFSGAIFQMIAHAFIVAGLFIVIGCVYSRCKTRDLNTLCGLGQVMPKCMYLALFIGMAALGLPFLMGFVGEFLSICAIALSDFNIYLIIFIIAASGAGLILSAGYVLYLFQKIFYSNILENFKEVKDITAREFSVLFVICAILLIFGICPMGVIKFFQSQVNVIIDLLQVSL